MLNHIEQADTLNEALPATDCSTTEAVGRYGTRESPLAIDQARAIIREDFLRFAGLVMTQVALPEGHAFAAVPALDLEHQLTWFLGCEVMSSNAGLSLHGHPVICDDKDDFQFRIEVRYFHPELHYRNTPRSKPRVSRQYNEGYSAHLWVDQGRPYWGMHRSLIKGNEFVRNMPSPEALAAQAVTRLHQAIQKRVMSEVGTAIAC
ncbi:hypothetical protein [Hydrogenophaga defluvii]|uniref:Uncharacterized protein n=1 Tax=Hydrogenophaga defluvii TaxID=249410 RepID=A0ABW2SFU4_9BURK